MIREELKSEPRHISQYMDVYLRMARTYVESKPQISGKADNPFVCLIDPAASKTGIGPVRTFKSS